MSTSDVDAILREIDRIADEAAPLVRADGAVEADVRALARIAAEIVALRERLRGGAKGG